MILYLVQHGLQINKRGGKFVIYNNEEKSERITPIGLVDAIVLFSRVQLTTDVITACLREKIPVFFIAGNGNYLGKLDSLEFKNVDFLYKHIKCALDEKCCLKYSKVFIESKIHNSKVMLKRWSKWSGKNIDISSYIEKLDNYKKQLQQIDNLDSLRGIEGNASKLYFNSFAKFLPNDFVWTGRNKRPPKDPVNAMLSLGYTLLAQTIHMYLEILGFEPQIGFMHQPKDLRTLLVLDTMEMFRAWIVDDLVLRLLNNKKITKENFIIDKHSQIPVLLDEDGLRIFISEYYKEVFKKSVEDNIIDGSKFVKLQYIEKNFEELKKSLVDEEFKYKGFKLK